MSAFCLLSSAFIFFVACPSLSASDPEPGMVQVGGWAATYGGDKDDRANIQQTSDGGYIMAGETESFGAGKGDLWVLKLRLDGTIDWQKTYGGASSDWANFVQQTSDGGYILAGATDSFGAGRGNLWVLKLRPDGTVEWQKTYGGVSSDWAFSVQQTRDGGYIVAGSTYSFGAGKGDLWVLKLRPDGTVEWQKTYGGDYMDIAGIVQQTSDGGYIVPGATKSFGAGGGDLWVLKLRPDGTVEWQKTYGGDSKDWTLFVHQTSDGGYVVAGGTSSFGAGGGDLWVLKLGPDGTIGWQKTYGGNHDDGGGIIQQANDGGYIVAGGTESFGAGDRDLWILKLRADGTVEWQKTYGGNHDDGGGIIQQANDGGYIVSGTTESFGAGKRDIWVLRLRPDGSFGYAQDKSVGPSCGLLMDTSIFAEDSEASVITTNVSPEDTSVDPQDSQAMVQDTEVSANFLCQP